MFRTQRNPNPQRAISNLTAAQSEKSDVASRECKMADAFLRGVLSTYAPDFSVTCQHQKGGTRGKTLQVFPRVPSSLSTYACLIRPFQRGAHDESSDRERSLSRDRESHGVGPALGEPLDPKSGHSSFRRPCFQRGEAREKSQFTAGPTFPLEHGKKN